MSLSNSYPFVTDCGPCSPVLTLPLVVFTSFKAATGSAFNEEDPATDEFTKTPDEVYAEARAAASDYTSGIAGEGLVMLTGVADDEDQSERIDAFVQVAKVKWHNPNKQTVRVHGYTRLDVTKLVGGVSITSDPVFEPFGFAIGGHGNGEMILDPGDPSPIVDGSWVKSISKQVVSVVY